MLPLFKFLPAMAAGLCLAASLGFFYVGSKKRVRGESLLFATICLLAAAYLLLSIPLYHSEAPQPQIFWFKARMVAGLGAFILMAWFLKAFENAASTKFAGAASATFLLILAVGLSLPADALLASNEKPEPTRLPWGETLYLLQGRIEPAVFLQYAAMLSILLFALLRAARLAREGQSSDGRALGLSMLLLLPFLLLDCVALVSPEIALPSTIEYAFIGVVAVMSRRLLDRSVEADIAEEALAERESRLKAIFNHSYQLTGLLDPQGRFVDANDTACAFVGTDKKAIEGLPFAESSFWPAEERPRLRDAVAQAARGEFAQLQAVIIDRDGRRRDLDVSIKPLRNPDGRIVGLIPEGRDITSLKETERSLKAALEQAESANHMKSVFLAMMSHELRTPLNPILGFATLLLDDESLADTQRSYLESIRDSGQALHAIINDIFDLTLLESGEVKTEAARCPLSSLFSEVKEQCADTAAAQGKPLRIEVWLDSRLPERVIADIERLRQLIAILAGNAVKFTDRGHIALGARLLEGDRMECYVEDTGIGVAEGDRERIFEPFVQADTGHTRRYGGIGLGLAIARRLAALLDGELRHEPRRPNGSRFAVRLPLKPAEPERPAAPRPAEDAAAATPEARRNLVLVVEDDEANREFLRKLLSAHSFDVETASDGQEGFERFMESRKRIAVALMDMQMPHVDGYEATARIRAYEKAQGDGRYTPVVALTAAAMKGDRERCLHAGCDYYLSKPIRAKELIETIQQLASAESRS